MLGLHCAFVICECLSRSKVVTVGRERIQFQNGLTEAYFQPL